MARCNQCWALVNKSQQSNYRWLAEQIQLKNSTIIAINSSMPIDELKNDPLLIWTHQHQQKLFQCKARPTGDSLTNMITSRAYIKMEDIETVVPLAEQIYVE